MEFRNPIVPNHFAQMYGSCNIDESKLAANLEEIKNISSWLKDFHTFKLPEKVSMLKALDKFQGKTGVIKLIINQKDLITISIMSGN